MSTTSPLTPAAAIRALVTPFSERGCVRIRGWHTPALERRPQLVVELTDHPDGLTLVRLELVVELDLNALVAVLRARAGERVLPTYDELGMGVVMDKRWLDIIDHLAAYNGERDDLEAIADIFFPLRGAVAGRKFNV